jgi:hypothetical protein
LIHSKDCNGIERCLVYDKTPLKNLMFGVSLLCLIPSLGLGVFIWIYLHKKKQREKKNRGETMVVLADQGNVDTFDHITKSDRGQDDHL